MTFRTGSHQPFVVSTPYSSRAPNHHSSVSASMSPTCVTQGTSLMGQRCPRRDGRGIRSDTQAAAGQYQLLACLNSHAEQAVP